MEFYEKYREHRDKFEIFAFHSASAKSFEELDEKMRSVIEKGWGVRDLPFPSLLDATGETLRNFSIKALGTHVLINPEGRVVSGDGERTLEKELTEWIEKSEKRVEKR